MQADRLGLSIHSDFGQLYLTLLVLNEGDKSNPLRVVERLNQESIPGKLKQCLPPKMHSINVSCYDRYYYCDFHGSYHYYEPIQLS